MSVCKTCRADVVWIARPDGSWYRPLQRLDALVDDVTTEELHSHQMLVLLDGELVNVRASGLYVFHVCPPDLPVTATRVLVPELDDLDSQPEVEAETEPRVPAPRQAEERPAKPWRYTYDGAEQVDCPKCGRPADEPCRNLGKGQWRGRDCVAPHAARHRYAVDSGVVEEGIRVRYRGLDWRDRAPLKEWLREYGQILLQPPTLIEHEEVTSEA